MDDHFIYYCYTFSQEQEKWLRIRKYNIDRMECFLSLADIVAREKKLVRLTRSQQVEILPGQIVIDNSELARLWGKDRKTVPKLLEAMESLGIFSSQKVGEVRIITLHCLYGWYVDGRFRQNDFGLRRMYGQAGLSHRPVPAAVVSSLSTTDDGASD